MIDCPSQLLVMMSRNDKETGDGLSAWWVERVVGQDDMRFMYEVQVTGRAEGIRVVLHVYTDYYSAP